MSDRHEDGQPAGRRDNGLLADRYVALADVDPRLGEHLLDLLRLADIPAYLEPPTDPRIAARYRIAGPIDRLYVQSALRGAAHEVVVAAAAEAGTASPVSSPDTSSGTAAPDGGGRSLLDGMDTDAEFARIVAGWSESTSAVRRRAMDDVDLDVHIGGNDSGNDSGNDTGATEDPAWLDEHFEPPPPPPFPIPSPAALGAVLIFALGLFVIARGDLLGLDGGVAFPLGVVAVLAGLGLLVMRLRPTKDDPDDDGAVL